MIDVIVENCCSDVLIKNILKRNRTVYEIEEIAVTIEATEIQLKDLKENSDELRGKPIYEVRDSSSSRPTQTLTTNNSHRFGQPRSFIKQFSVDPANSCYMLFMW